MSQIRAAGMGPAVLAGGANMASDGSIKVQEVVDVNGANLVTSEDSFVDCSGDGALSDDEDGEENADDSLATEPAAKRKKTKGRVKIKMEFISNKLRRYTTFSKRKTGIMKKAYELSTLTGTQIMLLVASETGHVYTFATPKLQPMITSESGKALIQTCLNTPDPPSDVAQTSRMVSTGYEETELAYAVENEDEKDSLQEEYDERVAVGHVPMSGISTVTSQAATSARMSDMMRDEQPHASISNATILPRSHIPSSSAIASSAAAAGMPTYTSSETAALEKVLGVAPGNGPIGVGSAFGSPRTVQPRPTPASGQYRQQPQPSIPPTMHPGSNVVIATSSVPRDDYFPQNTSPVLLSQAKSRENPQLIYRKG